MLRKKIGIRQIDTEDCGAACLASILNYYNLRIPLREIREKMKTGVDGTSILGIIRTADFYNLHAEAYELDSLDEIEESISGQEITFPFIAHIITKNELLHYVVVLGKHKDKLSIFDPADGYIKQKQIDFENVWTNIIISFGKKKTFVSGNYCRKSIKKYINLLAPLRKYLLWIFLLSFAISAISISGNFIYQYVIDSIVSEKIKVNFETDNVLRMLYSFVFYNKNYIFLALLCLYILQAILSYIKGKSVAFFSRNVIQNLVEPFHRKIMSLPSSYFHNRRSGNIISRFQDLEEIQRFFTEDFLNGMLDVIMAIFGAFVLLYISPVLFSIVLIILLVYIVVIIFFNRSIREISKDIIEQSTITLSAFKESIDGMDMIKAYSMESYFEEKIIRKSKILAELEYKGNILINKISVFVNTTEQIGILCSLFMGMFQIFKGTLTIGQLIVFENLIHFFIEPIKNLIGFQLNYQKLLISLNRIDDILETPSENEESKRYITNLTDFTINLRNVSFSYGYGTLLLDDLNMEIREGEKIAISGKSGSGKSTLLYLINGFQYPEEGKVYIGNEELCKIEPSVLRENILYVPQHVSLFEGTLRENLCVNQNITDKELQKVISGCMLDEIIDNSHYGLDILLQENGRNFSGGQRQRIAIAQALLRNPKVLILDESTNQLDKYTEEKILDFILETYFDRTILFATHNHSIQNRCDRIINIEHGKIQTKRG